MLFGRCSQSINPSCIGVVYLLKATGSDKWLHWFNVLRVGMNQRQHMCVERRVNIIASRIDSRGRPLSKYKFTICYGTLDSTSLSTKVFSGLVSSPVKYGTSGVALQIKWVAIC